MNNEKRSLIIQGDGTIFLDVEIDANHECRDKLGTFAELIKSPEHIHTYKITPLAIWNAASSKILLNDIMKFLVANSKFEIPSNIVVNIEDWYNRYGKVKLVADPNVPVYSPTVKNIPEYIYLISEDVTAIQEIASRKVMKQYITEVTSPRAIKVKSLYRGRLKQALIKISYPVEDLIGFLAGDQLDFSLAEKTRNGKDLHIRQYQKEAIDSFISGTYGNMSGIVVLPSGAGKTLVGMGVMEKIKENTLIITTGTIAVRQWIREILDKSNLSAASIGEYTGESKEILPVTVTSYQILTYHQRKKKENSDKNQEGEFALDNPVSDDEIAEKYPNLDVFKARNWGLIIYDEVHLLPAPVFRITSEIQAKKRLGLTATLVREDGKEDDVFSLIGPKKFDAPWKDLEKQGWIATAQCFEVRVKFPDEELKMSYAIAPPKDKYRVAAENPSKMEAIKSIISRLSPDDSILIIGDYIDQLERMSKDLNAPIITGKMKNVLRDELYSKFRKGDIKMLIVSKVANYAIDLPDANIAIQISGTFGSRQEEAQRLGRILRPKSTGVNANFYSIVTKDTVDQEYSMRRQLFLTERGYGYTIIEHEEILMNVRTEMTKKL